MSERIYMCDLKEGYTIEDNITHNGKVLVKKGTVLTPSLVERLRKWFKNSNDCVNISDSSISNSNTQKEIANMSNCTSPDLDQRILDGITNLHNASLEEFSGAYVQVKDCMEAIVSKIELGITMGYELDEFTKSDIACWEEHYYRSSKLSIALAHTYNATVPKSEKIGLMEIGLASVLHDYGKRFQADMSPLQKLMPAKQLFKKLNLHPLLLKKPFSFEFHSVYAYVALEGKVSERVRKMIMMSGLQNSTLNKLDGKSPEAKAAKIIYLCHVYDKLLEFVLQNNMTSPLENVLSVINHSVENGDISKSTYELFMENIMIYAPKTRVLLTTGEYAVVIANNQHFPTKPTVLTDNSKGIPRLINLSEETTITIKQILVGHSPKSDKVNEFMDTQLGNIISQQ